MPFPFIDAFNSLSQGTQDSVNIPLPPIWLSILEEFSKRNAGIFRLKADLGSEKEKFVSLLHQKLCSETSDDSWGPRSCDDIAAYRGIKDRLKCE
jgi:hypothetical protein